MKEVDPEAPTVGGERGSAELAHAPSLQSRVGNVLAVGLMSLLGIGMLTWYYARALTRHGQVRQNAQELSARRAQGEMPLPSLGRIDPPAAQQPAASKDPAPYTDPSARPSALETISIRESSLAPAPVPAAYGAPPTKTPAQLTLERQLSGAVFSSQSSVSVVAGAPPSALVTPPSTGSTPQDSGELAALLRPSVAATVQAQVLPTQRLLLPRGAFLDCTLETAIDSTLPGMTTCVVATDTFGADGAVVLLERGTKLVGETRGQAQQGSARVFVLWNEARTPGGVIVPLASPGADELGRAGLAGSVDHHFWERFGAAMLVSVIDGAVQAAVQSSRSNNNAVIVNPSATQDVMTEVLKGTISIPPTILKRQGDRIQVLVARDLDFRSVYELKSATAGH